MKGLLARSAIIGLALMLPFAILELSSAARPPGRDFLVLFGVLRLLPTLLVVAASPLMQLLRAGNGIAMQPLPLIARATVAVLVAWSWVSLVVDQWPCFLGVPNCD